MKAANPVFGHQLRQWRTMRSISQFNLALDASVSQRHLSWLETGKSQPSREMVIQLAEALDVPLRARNVLLSSAGYAPIYSETGIGAEAMAPVNGALRMMLTHHEPLPGLVLDRLWRIVMTNDAADRMLLSFGEPDSMWRNVDPSGHRSLARLTLHSAGLRPFISNWRELASNFMHRLRREALASGADEARQEYEELQKLVRDEDLETPDTEPALLPVLPLVIENGAMCLKLFSVISTFGTPQDITVDELRIESFFPADDATAQFFAS